MPSPRAILIAGEPWRPQGTPKRMVRKSAELWLRVVLEAGIEQVILPDPIDAEILSGESLALKSGLLEEPDRRQVCWDAGGLDPMQPQRPESERDQGAHR